MASKNKNKQDTTDMEEVDSKSPLIKFEVDTKSSNYSMLIYTTIAVAIVVVLYVISILTANYVFAAIAMSLAVLFAVALFLIYRQIHKADRVYTDIEIDEKVEKYKADLVDTFNGYEVSYTAQDVLDAADEYREKLEEQNASIADVDSRDIAAIFKMMIQDGKDSRARNKKDKEAMKKSHMKRNKKNG